MNGEDLIQRIDELETVAREADAAFLLDFEDTSLKFVSSDFRDVVSVSLAWLADELAQLAMDLRTLEKPPELVSR